MDKPTKHHSVYFDPPSGTRVYGVLGSKGRVKGQTRADKEKGRKKRVHHTKAGEYVSGSDKQIKPLTPEIVAQADRGRTNLSLLMRLGDFAPKILEERRKLELPRAGDRVYYDSSGAIRYGTVKQRLPFHPQRNPLGGHRDVVQLESGREIDEVQVHLRSRGPLVRHPALRGGIGSGGPLPDDILDPQRGGFGRRGEGEDFALDRARRGVDTNELYDRAIAEQLDFISRRGQRGVDTEGGGAVGGVDIETSRRPLLLLDRQESSASEPDSVLSRDLELTPTPRLTEDVPPQIAHFDNLTDEKIRAWKKANPQFGSGRAFSGSRGYSPAGGRGDEDL